MPQVLPVSAPPMPPRLPTVLAVGAWLKNTACLLRGGQAVWSVPHGDLSDPLACDQLMRSVEVLLAQADPPVAAVAHDLHPDFFSTQLAVAWAQRLGVPAVGVQHHHAHIAAVVADQGLRGPVVGLALDGVGLGTDGTAWGGELLWVHGAEWRRLGHLSPLALPGGDKAATEPWRMAASALHALGRVSDIQPRLSPLVGLPLAQGVHHLLAANLNCPLTTSAGRWFDAAAGALWQQLGLGQRQAHEAQAAMALQAAATRWLARQPHALNLSHPPCPVAQAGAARLGAGNTLDLRPLLAALFDAPADQADAAAAHFHLSLADGLADWAAAAARTHGTRTVCLGGGCWANTLLRGRVATRLHTQGLQVAWPGERSHGCGDAGLALGQAWVAAHTVLGTAPWPPATGQPRPTPWKEVTPCV